MCARASGTLLSGSFPASSAETESVICLALRFFLFASSTLARTPCTITTTSPVLAVGESASLSAWVSAVCAIARTGEHMAAARPDAANNQCFLPMISDPLLERRGIRGEQSINFRRRQNILYDIRRGDAEFA